MQLLKPSFFRLWGGIFLLICTLACKPESISPAELLAISEPQGEFLLYSPENSKYSFDIVANNQEGNKIEYVRVMLSAENAGNHEFIKITRFPAQIEMSLSKAISSITSLNLDDLGRESTLLVQFLAKKEKSEEEYIPTQLELKITCPEPGIAGLYETLSYGVSGPGGGGKFSDISSTVEIVALGPYEFSIGDATGGVFSEIWAAKPEKARLLEYCRTLEFPDFSDQFDDNFSGTAKLQADGSIELRWQSSYGDKGVTRFHKK